jgi:hypothetical protein
MSSEILGKTILNQYKGYEFNRPVHRYAFMTDALGQYRVKQPWIEFKLWNKIYWHMQMNHHQTEHRSCIFQLYQALRARVGKDE